MNWFECCVSKITPPDLGKLFYKVRLRPLYLSGFPILPFQPIEMTIQEKVKEKEQSVRSLLDNLRHHLNSQRQAFDKAPQSWEYISTLGITETRLKELLDYLNEKV